ncbi:MAG: AP2/ERF family transcription factor [Sedimentisphaerales bacterium]
MTKIHFAIPIPTFIETIILYFLLRYRKKKYGYPFRKIELTKGKFAKVDPEDFDTLSKFSWFVSAGTHSFYAYRSISVFGKSRAIAMHRQVKNVFDPLVFIDHINHDGLDNRKANLRLATVSQNNCNRRRRPDAGRSKYRGIDYDKGINKWRARIRFKNERILLGYFDSEEDAAHTYDKAAILYHGEFAMLNFPNDPLTKTLI